MRAKSSDSTPPPLSLKRPGPARGLLSATRRDEFFDRPDDFARGVDELDAHPLEQMAARLGPHDASALPLDDGGGPARRHASPPHRKMNRKPEARAGDERPRALQEQPARAQVTGVGGVGAEPALELHPAAHRDAPL